MSDRVFSASDVPKAALYVCCTDKFMSGWGPAKGCDNVLVFPCANESEASIVAANLDDRSDMIQVRIQTNPPRVQPYHYTQVKDPHDGRWLEPNAFR